jgi:hypothetical protein
MQILTTHSCEHDQRCADVLKYQDGTFTVRFRLYETVVKTQDFSTNQQEAEAAAKDWSIGIMVLPDNSM